MTDETQITPFFYLRPLITNESDTTQAIDRLRLLLVDHEPDGWPAVQMRDIAALLAKLDAAQAGIEAAVLAERERCAVICDEMQEHWCAYKDTAQLNGDIALSIAASGEPRAAEALAALIRTGGIREVKP